MGGFFGFLIIIFLQSPLEARLLNLNGNVELSFSNVRSDINDDATETNTFQQRYSIGSYGDLGTSRIGSYNANFSFIDQGITTNGEDQGDLKLYNYSLNANLFPRWYPLSIYAQRVTSENEFFQSTENTTDSYGLNWLLTTRYLPRISISLNQTDSRFEDSADTQVRSASIATSKSLGPTSINASYQLTEIDDGTGSPERFNNYNLGLSGAIPLVSKQELTVSLRANYTTNVETTSSEPAGSEIVQQRSAGATIAYRPRIEWLSSLSYDYTETPTSDQPFKSHIATANITGRPTTNTDVHASYSFLFFDITDTKIFSNYANLGGSWRPIFGLSTGVEVTGGLTDTSNTTDTTSLSQSYSYFISYTTPLKFVQMSTGYGLTYGNSQSDGSDSRSISNTINFGVSNIETRIVRVSFNYSFNNTSQSTGSDQISHYYSLSAESSYFRNLIRNGDSLYLFGSASYTDVNTSGATLSIDTKATYYLFSNLTFGTGWSHVDYSENPSGNQDNVFGEIQWIAQPFRRASLVLSLKETLQDSEAGIDRDTKEAKSTLTYQIGKVLLNLEYRYTFDDTETTDTITEFVYVRASRPF